jgi:hypothetical protein
MQKARFNESLNLLLTGNQREAADGGAFDG